MSGTVRITTSDGELLHEGSAINQDHDGPWEYLDDGTRRRTLRDGTLELMGVTGWRRLVHSDDSVIELHPNFCLEGTLA